METTIIAQARQAIALQIAALHLTNEALDASFEEAARLIARPTTTYTAGLGKSGFIARKMAATLTSVRMPARFIHPVEALHGDSGAMEAGDTLVVFSKSGETPEVLRLVGIARDLGMDVIAITSRPHSALAQRAHVAIAALIEAELDADNLLPTASTTTALVLADALSVCALHLAGGGADRLKRSHPDGAIGATLLRTVEEVMHRGDDVPTVNPSARMNDVLLQLTLKPLGIVCICDDDHRLCGVVTDGDVRRLVLERGDVSNLLVEDVMNRSPRTASVGDTLHHVLHIMEQGTRQISAMPILDNGRCVGVIRLHDIAKIQLATS